MAIVRDVEVDAIDLVDHLTHERPVFHVVVGVLERHANQGAHFVRTGEDFQFRQQAVVDEIQQCIASDPFFVGGPVAPAQILGQGGSIVVLEEFQLHLAVVEDL